MQWDREKTPSNNITHKCSVVTVKFLSFPNAKSDLYGLDLAGILKYILNLSSRCERAWNSAKSLLLHAIYC